MDQHRSRSHVRFVLAALSRDGTFITAHELHRRVRGLGHSTGLSTVYRALRELLSRNLVDVMVDEHGWRRYRHCSPGPHHHLVCSACHATVEIPVHSSPLPAWTPEDAPGFTDVLIRVTITGICAHCAQPS